MGYILFGIIGFVLGFVLCAGQIDKYIETLSEQKTEKKIDGKKYRVIEIIDTDDYIRPMLDNKS